MEAGHITLTFLVFYSNTFILFSRKFSIFHNLRKEKYINRQRKFSVNFWKHFSNKKNFRDIIDCCFNLIQRKTQKNINPLKKKKKK